MEASFSPGEFKYFCESYQINHIITALFYPQSNRQAERFVDTLKRPLKNVRSTPTKKALQQFLQVYRITPNNKTPASQSPAAVMFACRIQSVYDKLIPKQMKPKRTNIVPTKCSNPEKKSFSEFLKTMNLFGRWVQSREELGIWGTLWRVHNSCIKDILTKLGDTYQMRQIAVLQRKWWGMSSTTLLIFQPL